MESGLEDRNNDPAREELERARLVSMESGLEDRNNLRRRIGQIRDEVSQWSPA